MNWAEIKTNDIANGEGVRTSLFVSGCLIIAKIALTAKRGILIMASLLPRKPKRKFLPPAIRIM